MTSWTQFEVVSGAGNAVIANITQSVLLDTDVVETFGLELLAIIADHNPENLLLDFASVTRISTAVINALLVAKKKQLGNGHDILLCGLQEAVRHNFRILNLEGTVFNIFDDPETALGDLDIGGAD